MHVRPVDLPDIRDEMVDVMEKHGAEEPDEPSREPQRLAELLTDALERLTELSAVERVRHRHTTPTDDDESERS